MNHAVSRLEYRNKRYAYSHYTHAKAGRGSVWPFDVRRAVDRFFRLIGKCPDTGIDDILSHKEKMETHALRLIDSDTFIGWITLQRDHEQRPDIGISITADYQNEGYGPEAVTLFVNRLWEVYGLKRIYVRIFQSNLQSQRAFSKLGAILDSVAPYRDMEELFRQFPDDACVEAPLVHFYHMDLPITGK